MSAIKKVAAPGQDERDFSKNALGNNTTAMRPGKGRTILAHLAAGNSLNRFQINIRRKREQVPNRFGGKTSCCRYWLSGDDLQKAREIVRGR